MQRDLEENTMVVRGKEVAGEKRKARWDCAVVQIIT
jgi:hypothetical protein